MNVRPWLPEDAAAVAALVVADEERFYGQPSHVRAEDAATWLEFAKEAWVYEDDGRVVGAGWCGLFGPVGNVIGVAGEKGRGIGSDVIARAEERLRREPALERFHGIAPEPDEAARRLFDAHGYREVRRFYDMAIELEEPPPEPVLPDGLVLDEVRDGEERAFYDALSDAFEDHWDWHPTPYDEWLEMRRGQHHDERGPLWLVVRDGDEIAAVTRNEANRHGGGFVGAIGVRRPWRGQGLAKALLHRTFAEFWDRGLRRVSLGVDADSPTGATHLYERVGMHVESCTVVFEKAAS